MNKNYKLIGIFLFLFLPFTIMGQYASKYKLTNFQQVNETYLEFDLELHNTGTSAFGLEAAQCRIDFNNVMFEGQTIVGARALSCTSTDLVGEYGGDGLNPPTISQKITVTLNNGFFIFVINALPVTWPKIDLFQPGTYKKLARIKMLFTTGSGPNIKNRPFAEVLHNLAFNIVAGNHTLLRVNVYDVSAPPDVYKDTELTSGSPNYTAMPQPLREDLPASTLNRKLAKYCFTGTDDFTTGANWNVATSATITPKGTPPTSVNNAIIAGTATLSTNQTLADLTIGSSSTHTLTMNAGTQLSVDGTIYKENPSAAALSLKAGGGTSPTASLKNNTAGITATIEDYIPAWIGNLGWHLIASPVTSQDPNPAFIDAAVPANYDLYYYDGSVAAAPDCWRNYKQSPFLLTTGIGYLASYASAATHIFTGTMNALDVSPAISYYTTPGTAWNLIANPYPCALNANMTSWPKTNMNTTVHVLNGNTNGYYVYNADGSGDLPNGQIPAMQGFFVSSSNSSPTLTIPASAKLHSANNLFKTSGLSDHLILNVESPNNTNANTFIYFKNTNTDAVDPNDGAYMPDLNPDNVQMYSYINTAKFRINALGNYIAPTVVNMGFEPKVNGNFTIKANNIASFSPTANIILEDLQTNTTQNLVQNPTYNFTASTTDAVMRFKVYFDLGTVGINNNTANANENIYSFEKSIYIKSLDKINAISVYNLLGQEILNVQKPASNVFTLKQPSGYYLVRVVSNSTVYSQKVYIK